MPRLIGLTGKAHSGKDTIADYMWEKYGFMKLAFAEPLRAAATELFGIPREAMMDPVVKEQIDPRWGYSPRRILQILGNDALKPFFGNDVWVNRWFMTYSMFRHTDDVVVPDVRFDVEADFLRSMGGTIVHLQRPGAGLIGVTASHASEAGIWPSPTDLMLLNDGSIQDLIGKVDQLLLMVGDAEDE